MAAVFRKFLLDELVGRLSSYILEVLDSSIEHVFTYSFEQLVENKYIWVGLVTLVRLIHCSRIHREG